MTTFIDTSREELTVGDKEARGHSALRLGDLQAAGSAPRFAVHDGSDVRTLATWDLYFIEQACFRLPRTAGIVHFHTGWAGLATLRLGRCAQQLQFRCRESFDHRSLIAEPSASEVQASIIAYAAALDPRWTIVLTRVLNEVPDPDALVETLVGSRRGGGGLIVTAMGSPEEPYVFNTDLRFGLPDWAMIRRWGQRSPPLVSAIETTKISDQWPQHIMFGVAFGA